jgi:L-fuconolactonase
LPIVIDHAAKPPIAAGEFDPWREEITPLADLPNLMCKLSGLLTEMADGQPRDAMEPYVRHLAACFGAERLMWGSDWPVLLLADGFAEWHRLAAEMTGFDEAQLDHLFGGTAARFYGIAA